MFPSIPILQYFAYASSQRSDENCEDWPEPLLLHNVISAKISDGPQREKTCLRGFQHSETQTSLVSNRDWLEN